MMALPKVAFQALVHDLLVTRTHLGAHELAQPSRGEEFRAPVRFSFFQVARLLQRRQGRFVRQLDQDDTEPEEELIADQVGWDYYRSLQHPVARCLDSDVQAWGCWEGVGDFVGRLESEEEDVVAAPGLCEPGGCVVL